MKEITLKEVTQSFMKVLMSVNVQSHNIKAITQMFWDNPPQMLELVEWIKNNPKATESEIIRKAVNIHLAQ